MGDHSDRESRRTSDSATDASDEAEQSEDSAAEAPNEDDAPDPADEPTGADAPEDDAEPGDDAGGASDGADSTGDVDEDSTDETVDVDLDAVGEADAGTTDTDAAATDADANEAGESKADEREPGDGPAGDDEPADDVDPTAAPPGGEVPWDGLDDDHEDPWDAGVDPAEAPAQAGEDADAADADAEAEMDGWDDLAADEAARTDGATSHESGDPFAGDRTGERVEPFDPADSEYVEDATVEEPEDDDGPFGPGPEYDEEMPLADHIEEMVRRLLLVVAVGGVATILAFPTAEFYLNYLWQSYIPNPVGPPGQANRPYLYGPLELLLTELKVASIAGVVLGLPVFVYQSYRFMKPGLYPKERRYYLASVPTSLVLAVLGVLFAHFLLLPAIFAYFSAYTVESAKIAFALKETFNLIVTMMVYMAVVFQIPLFMMLAIMMNLVTRRWMEDKRILFWGAFATIAFTFVAVDPTGMAPIVIAVTMIALFETTLLLLRWVGQ